MPSMTHQVPIGSTSGLIDSHGGNCGKSCRRTRAVLGVRKFSGEFEKAIVTSSTLCK